MANLVLEILFWFILVTYVIARFTEPKKRFN